MNSQLQTAPARAATPTPNSPAAGAAWELALDLFFESWRVSDRWSPAVSLSFRRHALALSRLVGVAALSRAPSVIEIHQSSARRALHELDGEFHQAVQRFGCEEARRAHWIEWSARLGKQLSRWRLDGLEPREVIK